MFYRLCRTLVFGCCCILTTASQGFSADYEHTVEAKDMTFSWTIAGDTLAGKITGETEGWVGVGFNPSNKMQDANFVIGYVKDGKVEVLDEFGTTSTGHKSDDKVGGVDNVTVVGGSEEGGVTTIEFTIPVNSGDEKDGILTLDGDTVLLLAYGAGRDSFKSKHKYRTSLTVNLSTGAVK